MKEHDRVGEGHVDARPVEREFDRRRHAVAHPQHVGLVRFGPEVDREIDRRGRELGDVDPGARLVEHALRGGDRAGDRRARPLEVVGVADAHREPDTAPVVRRAHDDRAGVHVAVRQHDALAVVGLQPRRAHVDLFDRTLVLARADLVADVEGAPPKNQHAREEVLEHVLEREPDRDRRDAEAGEHVARPERREHDHGGGEDGEESDQGRGEPAQQVAERAVELRAPRRARREAPGDARRQEPGAEDDQPDEQVGDARDDRGGERLHRSHDGVGVEGRRRVGGVGGGVHG
ncbi:MAG TPA: hypothetical protein VFS43_17600 [Polyangiaceae bacterium]|nr:hypothetical protein [Polyangiaceae bacterium]